MAERKARCRVSSQTCAAPRHWIADLGALPGQGSSAAEKNAPGRSQLANAPVDDHRRIRVRRSVIEHTFVLLRWGVDVVAAHDQHVECAGRAHCDWRSVVTAVTEGGVHA